MYNTSWRVERLLNCPVLPESVDAAALEREAAIKLGAETAALVTTVVAGAVGAAVAGAVAGGGAAGAATLIDQVCQYE